MGQERRVIAAIEQQCRRARVFRAEDLIAILLQRRHILRLQGDEFRLPALQHGCARAGLRHQEHARFGKAGDAGGVPIVQIRFVLDYWPISRLTNFQGPLPSGVFSKPWAPTSS